MCIPHLFIHLSVEWTMGLFPPLAIVNNIATNTVYEYLFPAFIVFA